VKSLTFDRANALCGLIFVGIGIFFGVQSLILPLGTAFRMGPGYFPLVLAGILVLLGLIILVQSMRAEGDPIGPIAWRGMVLILFSPVFFGLTLRGLGFVPALLLTALIASFASVKMTPLVAVAVSAALTVFATLVFVQGLELPFRLFGPWLSF